MQSNREGKFRSKQYGCNKRLDLLTVDLGLHLFVKVSRPGDSEVTSAVFESSCHLLLPV